MSIVKRYKTWSFYHLFDSPQEYCILSNQFLFQQSLYDPNCSNASTSILSLLSFLWVSSQENSGKKKLTFLRALSVQVQT